MEQENRFEKELGGALLASVSRSFYLTLKALPAVLREPISLAYLLARTADTIADTAAVPAAIRLSALDDFAELIESVNPEKTALLAARLEEQFRPLQTDAAEAVLMSRIEDALAWLASVHGSRLQAIRDVLKPIIHGQKLDIKRFPAHGPLCSLETTSELEEYTWLVAGCVGEFWTKLCFALLPEAFVAGSNEPQLIQRGIDYGKGLQLVNILRDIQKDARLGRCYLPAQQWRQPGLCEADIAENPALLRPVWEQWLTIAETRLQSGIDYVAAIQHSRLRHATALPVLLGIRTLSLLKTASDEALLAGVKINRLEVGKIILQATIANSPSGISQLASKLARMS
jgi:farnesyl-diphosphate farnesyltransferase